MCGEKITEKNLISNDQSVAKKYIIRCSIDSYTVLTLTVFIDTVNPLT